MQMRAKWKGHNIEEKGETDKVKGDDCRKQREL